MTRAQRNCIATKPLREISSKGIGNLILPPWRYEVESQVSREIVKEAMRIWMKKNFPTGIPMMLIMDCARPFDTVSGQAFAKYCGISMRQRSDSNRHL